MYASGIYEFVGIHKPKVLWPLLRYRFSTIAHKTNHTANNCIQISFCGQNGVHIAQKDAKVFLPANVDRQQYPRADFDNLVLGSPDFRSELIDWGAINSSNTTGSLSTTEQALLWDLVLFGDGGAFVDRIITPVFRCTPHAFCSHACYQVVSICNLNSYGSSCCHAVQVLNAVFWLLSRACVFNWGAHIRNVAARILKKDRISGVWTNS